MHRANNGASRPNPAPRTVLLAGDLNRRLTYGRAMATETPDSPFLPPRWVVTAAWKMHRALYRWSGGRFGLRRPRPDRYGLARLTTTGRRSGEARSVMIAYYLDGADVVTMAMNGWGEAEPAWWLNLQANPKAEVALVDGPIEVVGRAAEEEERERLWDRWREFDKGLDGFATRRPSETAVVILTPTT